MFKNSFYTYAAICLATNIIRTIYEILKHKKIIIPGRLSFVVMFINMVLLWASWSVLCESDMNRIDFSMIVKATGITLSILGLISFLTALLTIKTLESYEGDLMTSGIYSKIRHPMYLGFIFWLIGFPLYFGAISAFPLSILFICNVLYWRFLEEKELVERFPTYREYRRKTLF